MNDGPKYPNIKVQLTGEDGNAMSILGRIRREMKRAGVSNDEISEFMMEAMSGNYDHLLQTCIKWIDVS